MNYWFSDLYGHIDGLRVLPTLSCVTDDIACTMFNGPTMNGREELKRGLEQFWQMIEGMNHRFVTVIEQGDMTMFEAAVSYARKDGKEVELRIATALQRRGNQASAIRVYGDASPLFA